MQKLAKKENCAKYAKNAKSPKTLIPSESNKNFE